MRARSIHQEARCLFSLKFALELGVEIAASFGDLSILSVLVVLVLEVMVGEEEEGIGRLAKGLFWGVAIMCLLR